MAALLKRIYDAVEPIVPFTTAGQFFDDPVEAMRAAFLGGKVWTNEAPRLIGEVEWTADAGLPGGRAIPFPGNRRWRMADERNRRNWNAFLVESRIDSNGLPEDIRAEAMKAFRNRFENTGHAAESGASYFHVKPEGTTEKALENVPNIDVKGRWTRRSGADGGFTPPEKLFRGLQIKWFGFT